MACEFPQRCGNLANYYTLVTYLLIAIGLPLVRVAFIAWTADSCYKRCDVALADLGFFRGGDFGNPSERSIEGAWVYGRMKFERL